MNVLTDDILDAIEAARDWIKDDAWLRRESRKTGLKLIESYCTGRIDANKAWIYRMVRIYGKQIKMAFKPA